MKKEEKIKKVREIAIKYDIPKNDAIVIFYMKSIVFLYEKFIVDTLQVEKDPNSQKYKAIIPVTRFYNHTRIIAKEITKMETQLRKTHSHVLRVFSEEIQIFITKIEELPPEGDKAYVLQIRTRLSNFGTKLSDLIKLGNPDDVLEETRIQLEDRASKTYKAGIKALNRHPESIILLYWLIEKGKGRYLSKRQMAVEMPTGEAWVEKQVEHIMDDAPEFFDLALGQNKEMLYCIPAIFSKFKFGRDST